MHFPISWYTNRPERSCIRFPFAQCPHSSHRRRYNDLHTCSQGSSLPIQVQISADSSSSPHATNCLADRFDKLLSDDHREVFRRKIRVETIDVPLDRH